MIEDDEIVHFGVKGMRWGVRKAAERIESHLRKKADERKPGLGIAGDAAFKYGAKLGYNFGKNPHVPKVSPRLGPFGKLGYKLGSKAGEKVGRFFAKKFKSKWDTKEKYFTPERMKELNSILSNVSGPRNSPALRLIRSSRNVINGSKEVKEILTSRTN